MNSAPEYRQLLWKSLAALLLCAALVWLCYLFVDRPVAFFVHDRKLSNYLLLKWLTYPPPILQACTPVVLAALLVRRLRPLPPVGVGGAGGLRGHGPGRSIPGVVGVRVRPLLA